MSGDDRQRGKEGRRASRRCCCSVNANHCASVWQRGWDWGWGWGWDMRRPVTKEHHQEQQQEQRLR